LEASSIAHLPSTVTPSYNAAVDLQTRVTLMLGIRDGNPRAWDEFCRLYQPMVRLYVVRFRIDENNADDLVQEVFAKLHAQLPRFDLDHGKGKFRGWLRSVTDNTVRDWLKSKQRQQRRVGAIDAHDLEQQFAHTDSQEQHRQLEWRRAVLDIVVRQVREEFKDRAKVFACFEQLTLQNRPARDVAADLKINTPNTVYVYSHRVLKRVRELCEGYDEEMGEFPATCTRQ
jgi:RNA polymerase sigma factor (sigma-70 family)